MTPTAPLGVDAEAALDVLDGDPQAAVGIVTAALRWRAAQTPPPPGPLAGERRDVAVLEARRRVQQAAAADLRAAVDRFIDSEPPAPVRAWLAARGLATAGDWCAAALFAVTFAGIGAWIAWRAVA